MALEVAYKPSEVVKNVEPFYSIPQKTKYPIVISGQYDSISDVRTLYEVPAGKNFVILSMHIRLYCPLNQQEFYLYTESPTGQELIKFFYGYWASSTAVSEQFLPYIFPEGVIILEGHKIRATIDNNMLLNYVIIRFCGGIIFNWLAIPAKCFYRRRS